MEGFATLNGGTTGGGAAAPTTVATVAALKECATASTPRVCRVQGTITFEPFEEVRVTSNKTIIGVGTSGHIVNGGFFLGTNVNNVIIRNLHIRDSFIEGDWDGKVADNDGVQMDTARNIWIDHNRFSRIADGMIDSRKDTTNLTVSWNILENQNKAFGIGWTENVTSEITIHHNWLNNTHQRNPSADNILRAHLYNNVMENNAGYGNYARGGTHMVLENSVFVNTKDPHYYDTGSLVAIGNSYTNTTGQREQSGTSYGVFNPNNYYSYVLHPTNQVSELVKRCAGPRPELGQ